MIMPYSLVLLFKFWLFFVSVYKLYCYLIKDILISFQYRSLVTENEEKVSTSFCIEFLPGSLLSICTFMSQVSMNTLEFWYIFGFNLYLCSCWLASGGGGGLLFMLYRNLAVVFCWTPCVSPIFCSLYDFTHAVYRNISTAHSWIFSLHILSAFFFLFNMVIVVVFFWNFTS